MFKFIQAIGIIIAIAVTFWLAVVGLCLAMDVEVPQLPIKETTSEASLNDTIPAEETTNDSVNFFGKFISIYGMLSFLYLIGDILRRYCLHLESSGDSTAEEWLISGISAILLYLNPIGLLFYTLQKKDIERAVQFSKKEYAESTLPIEQRLAFCDGYRRGYEECAAFSVIENTNKKPQYGYYAEKECFELARQTYPSSNDSIYDWQ